MDFITFDQARQDIVDLGLPQIILDVFDDQPLPHDLDIHFRVPYEIFDLEPEGQAAYGFGRITPVWTNGGTIVAYHHAPGLKGFFRFFLETPGEECEPIGLSWQQVLVQEFKDLWEGEWPDERLREVAGWFEFKYLELLIPDLAQTSRNTFEKDEEWYRGFLKKIEG